MTSATKKQSNFRFYKGHTEIVLLNLLSNLLAKIIMTDLLLNIGNISGGILLGLATLDKWDGERDFFNKIAGFLAPFQTIIGGALVVLAILKLMGGHNILFNIASILGGFLLLTHVIGKAPAFGDTLMKLSDKLMPFKAIIGIGLIIIGIIGIF